jgi:anthranilate synthase component II
MIVILDNYDSFVYNIYQLVSSLRSPLGTAYDCRVVRNDALSLAELIALQPEALILSPGPGGPEDAGICLKAAHYFMGKIPVLGVCLGHQVIGQVLGAKVVRAPEARHGKVSWIEHQQTGVFEGLSSPQPVARYHSLCLDRVPTGCEALAYSDDGCLMAFQHRYWPVMGVQFHPESIATPQGKAMLHHFLHTIPALERAVS